MLYPALCRKRRREDTVFGHRQCSHRRSVNLATSPKIHTENRTLRSGNRMTVKFSSELIVETSALASNHNIGVERCSAQPTIRVEMTLLLPFVIG